MVRPRGHFDTANERVSYLAVFSACRSINPSRPAHSHCPQTTKRQNRDMTRLVLVVLGLVLSSASVGLAAAEEQPAAGGMMLRVSWIGRY